MSQIKYYIVAFLICLYIPSSAQTGDDEDVDLLRMNIENQITQAGFDIDRGNYFNAKDNLEKALETAIKIDDKKRQGIIHAKIANLQFIVEEMDNAIISLLRAASIQREISDYGNLAITYNISGKVHASKKQYATALDYFNSSKTKFEEENLEELIPEVCLNEAKVYMQLNDYKSAKASLEKTILLAKQYDQPKILSSALISSGNVMLNLNNTILALSMTNEGLEIAKKGNFFENINAGYLTLSDIYQKTENYELANQFLKKHITLSDSIQNIKRENLSPEKKSQYLNQYNNDNYQYLKTRVEEQ